MLGIEDFVREVVCNDNRGGWRVLACRASEEDASWTHRWGYGASGLLEHVASIRSEQGWHEYYGLNAFTKKSGEKGLHRRASNVYALANIGVDIDIHGVRGPRLHDYKNQLVNLLDDIFEGGRSSLAPTVVVDSGHGIQLVWTLERSVPVASPKLDTTAAQKLYNTVWRELAAFVELRIQRLSFATVDHSVICDRARVFRMPGTMNDDEPTVVLSHGRKHALRELSMRLAKVPKSKKILKSAAAQGSSASSFINDIRLANLEALARGERGITKGYRNTACHIYANSLRGIYGLEELAVQRRYLEEFNAIFDAPLSKKELDKVERSVNRFFARNKRPYYYTLETIVRKLDLTEEEVAEYFRASKWEGRYRSSMKAAASSYKKRLERNERNERILDLIARGHSQKEVAAIEGCSTATVCRVVNGGVPAKELKRTRAEKARQMASEGFTRASIAVELGCSRQTVSRSLSSTEPADDRARQVRESDAHNFIFDHMPVVTAAGPLGTPVAATAAESSTAVSAAANSCQLSFDDVLTQAAAALDFGRMEAFCDPLDCAVCNTAPSRVVQT